MTGQEPGKQNSVIVPYNILIWLKKSTAENKNSVRVITCVQKHNQPYCDVNK